MLIPACVGVCVGSANQSGMHQRLSGFLHVAVFMWDASVSAVIMHMLVDVLSLVLVLVKSVFAGPLKRLLGLPLKVLMSDTKQMTTGEKRKMKNKRE